ncbi:hypothetical protein DNU06_17535, partial [Putridiphycobacter roseus]
MLLLLMRLILRAVVSMITLGILVTWVQRVFKTQTIFILPMAITQSTYKRPVILVVCTTRVKASTFSIILRQILSCLIHKFAAGIAFSFRIHQPRIPAEP